MRSHFSMALCSGLVSATLLLGCHPSAEEFAAKDLEAQQYKKKLTDESQKTTDLQAKVSALETKLKADDQRISELSSSKKQLEEAKQDLEKKSGEYEQLANSLKGEIEAGKIELSELKGKMTVKMKDKILFASGSATIGKEGKQALEKIAEAFRDLKGKMIRVEGHTDNVPTAKGMFPTNWELSSARAIAVVRFLQEKGVDPANLAAAGYSQYEPVASNDTPEGRSQNRRIEIVLAPADKSPGQGGDATNSSSGK